MGADGTLAVPQEPIIPFIEGDGTGVDIWPAAKLVLDAAAAKHGHGHHKRKPAALLLAHGSATAKSVGTVSVSLKLTAQGRR